MGTELKNRIEQNLKKRNITTRSILQTIINSLNGIRWYAKDGKSIIIYAIGLILTIIMSIVYRINGLEWILIICIQGIMLTVELLNTAVEATCNAVTREYNNYVKIAKDCGSAATFIIFIVYIILNIIIFLPKIVAMFKI